MDRIALIMVGMFLLSGCAVMTTTPPSAPVAVNNSGTEHIFPSDEAIRKLLPGISREEALALIGRTVTTGYELKEATAGEYQPVTANNPHRSQKITKGGESYEVDFYLTSVRKADGVISDDELTPVVFQDNKLVGKGWEFFNSRVKR